MAIIHKINQDNPQFGSTKPGDTGGSPECAACEAMLTDALDGTLIPHEQARFDLHLTGCAACSQMLADAQRGAAWLEMLRTPRPEPPAALLEHILAQTSGQSVMPFAEQTETAGLIVPSKNSLLATPLASPLRSGKVLPIGSFNRRNLAHTLKETFYQPRLAMTAAMAFFSIGLTLNLTGVQLNQLHVRDLKPATLRRSFYQANAHVVRYYENLRVVYELESRVRELQRVSDSDTQETPQPSTTPQQPSTRQPGTSQPQQRRTPKGPGTGSSRQAQPIQQQGSSVVAAHATRNESDIMNRCGQPVLCDPQEGGLA